MSLGKYIPWLCNCCQFTIQSNNKPLLVKRSSKNTEHKITEIAELHSQETNKTPQKLTDIYCFTFLLSPSELSLRVRFRASSREEVEGRRVRARGVPIDLNTGNHWDHMYWIKFCTSNQCTCNVHCTMYIQCTLYNVHYPMYIQ